MLPLPPKRVFFGQAFRDITSYEQVFPAFFAPEWGAQFHFIFTFVPPLLRLFCFLLVCDSSDDDDDDDVYVKKICGNKTIVCRRCI